MNISDKQYKKIYKAWKKYSFVEGKKRRKKELDMMLDLLIQGYTKTFPALNDDNSLLTYDKDKFIRDVYNEKLTPDEILDVTRSFCARTKDLMTRERLQDDEVIVKLVGRLQKVFGDNLVNNSLVRYSDIVGTDENNDPDLQ